MKIDVIFQNRRYFKSFIKWMLHPPQLPQPPPSCKVKTLKQSKVNSINILIRFFLNNRIVEIIQKITAMNMNRFITTIFTIIILETQFIIDVIAIVHKVEILCEIKQIESGVVLPYIISQNRLIILIQTILSHSPQTIIRILSVTTRL